MPKSSEPRVIRYAFYKSQEVKYEFED
jgi:hypothetical protein